MHPEVDEIGDGDDLEPVLLRENFEIRKPRHAPVFIHHFTDHTRFFTAGKTRQITSRFGMSGTV